MKICYKAKEFRADSMDIIVQAEVICDDYHRQGYDLTLRQLYYQCDLVCANCHAEIHAGWD